MIRLPRAVNCTTYLKPRKTQPHHQNTHKMPQKLLDISLLASVSLIAVLAMQAISLRLHALPNLAEILPQETEGFIVVNPQTLYIPQQDFVYTSTYEPSTFSGNETTQTIEQTDAYTNVRSRLPHFEDGFVYGNSNFFKSIFPDCLQKLMELSPYFGASIKADQNQIYIETFFAIDKTKIAQVDSLSIDVPENVDIHCQLLEESDILYALASKCQNIVSTQKFFDDGIFARTTITLQKP